MNSRAILALAISAAASPVLAQQSCEDLASASIPGIRIESAVSVPAGSFALPGSPNAAKIQVPAFCRVAASVDK